jgi:hypothetical protein
MSEVRIGIVLYPGTQLSAAMGLADLFQIAGRIADRAGQGAPQLQVRTFEPAGEGIAEATGVKDASCHVLILPPSLEAQQGSHGERRQRHGVGPAVLASTGDAVDQGRHAADARERTEEVGLAAVQLRFNENTRSEEYGKTDGKVDEEDPAPSQRARENAAQQKTCHDAQGGHAAMDTYCLVSLGPFRKGRGDQGQGVGCRKGRANPLKSPKAMSDTPS